MNSIRPGLNKARAAATSQANAETADTFASIASMMDGVKDFAESALKAELAGGAHQDQAGAVIDAISDASGKALEAESKISERRQMAGNGSGKVAFQTPQFEPVGRSTPMPAEKMDAVALLKADHRKVEELFEKFEAAKADSAKQKLAQQICLELSVHARIEEEIFYPACAGQIEDEDLLPEAYVEHDGAKVLIAEILAGEPSNEFYDAKVKVLSEQIKHHVKEEEKRSEGLFAEAKEAGLDMDALGERLLARKKELLKEYAAKLPPPETRSFTGHEITQGEPVEQAA